MTKYEPKVCELLFIFSYYTFLQSRIEIPVNSEILENTVFLKKVIIKKIQFLINLCSCAM